MLGAIVGGGKDIGMAQRVDRLAEGTSSAPW
jgi:hypothetical protein